MNLDISVNSYHATRIPRLLYIWGHSSEFDDNGNWEHIEEICEKLANNDEIWYATNMEIYDYVKAYNNLIFNVECSCVFNPSGQTVWFEKDGVQHSVGANETIRI